MRRIWLLAAGLVIIVMAETLSAQRTGGPPPAATGVVGGRVTAADTGQPLRRAQIRLVGTASTTARTTTTDGDGRFMFANVAAGDYTVSATKPAYLDMVFGARKSGLTAAGTPLRVADGQKIENLELKLPRGGVISGVIIDEFGDPAFNTSVRVMRYVFSNGERYATPAGQPAFTDDRGAYRIAGLPPGELHRQCGTARGGCGSRRAQCDAPRSTDASGRPVEGCRQRLAAEYAAGCARQPRAARSARLCAGPLSRHGARVGRGAGARRSRQRSIGHQHPSRGRTHRDRHRHGDVGRGCCSGRRPDSARRSDNADADARIVVDGPIAGLEVHLLRRSARCVPWRGSARRRPAATCSRSPRFTRIPNASMRST